MKNYGLQLKEIPIIFRGGIEAADPGGEPFEFPYTNVVGYSEIDNVYQFGVDNIPELIKPEDMKIKGISFSVDGGKTTRYINPPKDNFEGIYYWGSMMDFETGEFENPDFPFMLTINNNGDEEEPLSYINLYVNYAPPKNTKALDDPAADFAIVGTIGGGDPAPATKTMQFELTGNGSIQRFYVRFAVGENGTLHINPYVILNGNVRVDLCNFADGGFKYINGDDETISMDCYVPVETHALACIDIENVGEYPSIIDAAMVVQYEDFIEPESIVGYEGINLRRGRL